MQPRAANSARAPGGTVLATRLCDASHRVALSALGLLLDERPQRPLARPQHPVASGLGLHRCEPQAGPAAGDRRLGLDERRGPSGRGAPAEVRPPLRRVGPRLPGRSHHHRRVRSRLPRSSRRRPLCRPELPSAPALVRGRRLPRSRGGRPSRRLSATLRRRARHHRAHHGRRRRRAPRSPLAGAPRGADQHDHRPRHLPGLRRSTRPVGVRRRVPACRGVAGPRPQRRPERSSLRLRARRRDAGGVVHRRRGRLLALPRCNEGLGHRRRDALGRLLANRDRVSRRHV